MITPLPSASPLDAAEAQLKALEVSDARPIFVELSSQFQHIRFSKTLSKSQYNTAHDILQIALTILQEQSTFLTDHAHFFSLFLQHSLSIPLKLHQPIRPLLQSVASARCIIRIQPPNILPFLTAVLQLHPEIQSQPLFSYLSCDLILALRTLRKIQPKIELTSHVQRHDLLESERNNIEQLIQHHQRNQLFSSSPHESKIYFQGHPALIINMPHDVHAFYTHVAIHLRHTSNAPLAPNIEKQNSFLLNELLQLFYTDESCLTPSHTDETLLLNATLEYIHALMSPTSNAHNEAFIAPLVTISLILQFQSLRLFQKSFDHVCTPALLQGALRTALFTLNNKNFTASEKILLLVLLFSHTRLLNEQDALSIYDFLDVIIHSISAMPKGLPMQWLLSSYVAQSAVSFSNIFPSTHQRAVNFAKNHLHTLQKLFYFLPKANEQFSKQYQVFVTCIHMLANFLPAHV